MLSRINQAEKKNTYAKQNKPGRKKDKQYIILCNLYELPGIVKLIENRIVITRDQGQEKGGVIV